MKQKEFVLNLRCLLQNDGDFFMGEWRVKKIQCDTAACFMHNPSFFPHTNSTSHDMENRECYRRNENSMKATGIVRRIDDLGRVVIPKEIRRTLRIREGDPLEIFTDREGEIILKKYSPIGELGQFAKQYADALGEVTGHGICITDKDQIIAVSGGLKKEWVSKAIAVALEEVIEKRETFAASRQDRKYVRIIDTEEDVFSFEAVSTIVCEGDAIGAVIFLTKEDKQKFGELEMQLARTAAHFLGKQMEQ